MPIVIKRRKMRQNNCALPHREQISGNVNRCSKSKKTQDFSWVSRSEHLAHETNLRQHVSRRLTTADFAGRSSLDVASVVAEVIGRADRADRQLASATAEIRDQ